MTALLAIFKYYQKYTFSKQVAFGEFVSKKNGTSSEIITENEKARASTHSFGIGIGIILDISDEFSDSVALNLYFNNLNLGTSINKLKGDKRFNTEDVLGIGVVYYFNLKKK